MSQETVSKTDQILSVILEKALIAAEKTGQFVVEQAPDVVQQLLLYHTASAAVWTLIGAAILIFTWRVAAKKASYWAAADSDRSHPKWDVATGPAVLWVIVALLSGLIGTAMFLHNMSLLLKLVLAPKVWLLEYAASLIR